MANEKDNNTASKAPSKAKATGAAKAKTTRTAKAKATRTAKAKATRTAKAKATDTAQAKARAGSGAGDSKPSKKESPSLVDQLIGLTSQVASGAVDFARTSKAIPLMFTDNWVKDAYMKTLDVERLQAMADAGSFLKDAREVAGLNISELAEAVGLSDSELLEEVEQGRATLPIETILRIASLTARHDPIPFIIKFLRTYNPSIEQTLEKIGIMKLPKQYERERRFVNIYRGHDILRELSDAEFERFIGYISSATDFTLDIMLSEKSERKTRRGAAAKKQAE
jgi:transcriptional regulator with XRE-family HTH domain